MELSDIGFDAWFAAQADACGMDGCGFARVAAVDRGAFRVLGACGEAQAELSGRLSFTSESPADLPCVGDWVTASFYNDGSAAIIHRVFPRRSLLRRRAAGDTGAVQMIAANIDTAFLVQSCHFDFNPSRLERYLVMAAEGGVKPVVLLTKTDLVGPEELARKRAEVAALTQARIIAMSCVTGEGLPELGRELAPGRTCCLLGSSGVGKSTLINRLLGREALDTRAVSGSGEGTHTTTRRQLMLLDGGAMLVDTPGMRELGVAGGSDDVDSGLGGLSALAARCRYADCTHLSEPGCAVLEALARGELSRERYDNYLKLRREAEFFELSSLERRRKDKAFGRFLKNVKKQLRD
jgi:ribosome biogenesis GTPase